jgi:hypothetical protein
MSQILREQFSCDMIRLVPPETQHDHRGAFAPALYAFVRDVGGETREAVVDVRRQNEPVSAGVIEYVCRRLKIDDTRDLTHAPR